MPSTPARSSTRLENIALRPGGASLELEGRPIALEEAKDPAAVAAFRSFYESAVATLAAARPQPPAPQGWLSKMRSWLGQLFGGRAEPPAPDRKVERVVPDALGTTPKSANTSGTTRSTPEPGASAPPPILAPPLRAVVGDKDGVHLVWNIAQPGAPERLWEQRQPLDSPLARSLQDCYHRLGQAGYKIVGLDLQPIAPAAPAAGGRAGPPAPPGPIPDPARTEKPAATWIMRLLPESKDHPGVLRASPADTEENIRPLPAPEKLSRALRTAADPGCPADDRLVALRCAPAKNGLKIVAVGLGEPKSGHAPRRWEEVADWLERQPAPAPDFELTS